MESEREREGRMMEICGCSAVYVHIDGVYFLGEAFDILDGQLCEEGSSISSKSFIPHVIYSYKPKPITIHNTQPQAQV
jgi:hypothetical protein